MKALVKSVVRNIFAQFGYKVVGRHNGDDDVPVEFEQREIEIFRYVLNKKLKMVSPERLIATIQACQYVLRNDTEGDFVECGIWRGGNSLAAKLKAFITKHGLYGTDEGLNVNVSS